MKHLWKYILLSVVLTLMTGCNEEIFIRELDFQGETEPEMLVLKGTEWGNSFPMLVVNHSFFFDSKDKSPKNDYVMDAVVTMRLNGKDYSMNHLAVGQYRCKDSLRLHPLDTVEFTVTHPKYSTATARQIMPGIVHSTLASYELQSNYWAVVDLDFDAYQGNADDMIGIRVYGRVEATQRITQRKDTLSLDYTYSNDIVFAQAQNLSVEGYYGTLQEVLYFPASALQQPRNIRCFADRYWTQKTKNQYKNVRLISMQVDVYSYSHDAYTYNKSMYNYLYNGSLPAPSGLPQKENTIMDDIMDELEEVLGEQEPRQVYTNVNGGLGCVTGQILCGSHQVIK